MKRSARWAAAAAIFVSMGLGSVGTAGAVSPGHLTRSWPTKPIPVKLFNHVPPSIQAIIARILAEECQVFPIICTIVVPPTTTTTTVPPTTTTTVPSSTTTTVPTTVTTAPPTTVITLPIIGPVVLPASSVHGSSCTVTMTGGGTAQCTQSASVSSSS